MMDILKVQEKPVDDYSIYALDYFPFLPITGTQYNNPGVIQINIENQDEYFLHQELDTDRCRCYRTK